MPIEFAATLLSMAGTVIVAILAGVISYAAGRGMKNLEWRLAIQKEKIAIRSKLYSEFLAEADRLILLSIDKKMQGVVGFQDITRIFASIELMAASNVVEAAREIVSAVLSSHSSEPKTKKLGYDRKKVFIEAAKAELLDLELAKA